MYVCVFPYAQPEDKPFEGRRISQSLKMQFCQTVFSVRWLQEGCHTARPIHCLVMMLNLRICPAKQETSSKMLHLGLKKVSLTLGKYAESTDNIEAFSVDWKYLKELFLPCLPFLLPLLDSFGLWSWACILLPGEFLFNNCPFSKEYSKVHNTEWVSSEHFRQSYSANPAACHLYENPVFTTLVFPWGQGILNRLFSQWVPLWM